MTMALSIVLAAIGQVLPMERERSRAVRVSQEEEEEESPGGQHAAEQRRVADSEEEERVLERLLPAASS
jgi:hypothetical protein